MGYIFNICFKFRLVPLLFIFASQACPNSGQDFGEGELTPMEEEIFSIFLPDQSDVYVETTLNFVHSLPPSVVEHLRAHQIEPENLVNLAREPQGSGAQGSRPQGSGSQGSRPQGSGSQGSRPQGSQPARTTTSTQSTPTGGHDYETLAEYLPPDIHKLLRRLDRNIPFTPTMNKHHFLVNKLVDIFIRAPSIEIVVAIGTHLFRDNINRGLLIHALAVALMHRPDSRDYRVGRLFQMLTGDYLDGRLRDDIINEAQDQDESANIDIWRNYTTASDREPEHRLAYFREDLGINLHHWHWHVVYPYQGPDNIVRKDRRGELFYYFHQQIMARYDAERLSNKLGRVQRLNNYREPMLEGYFPKLDTNLASRSWPSRPKGMTLRDIDRLDVNEKFDIQDLERWRDRLYNAIHMRSVTFANGTEVPLDEKIGIDILGNAVEASPNLSPNVDFYGQLHNNGHTAISFVHDPDGRHMENFGVMGTPSTAMRDPIFYRWHAFINDIFFRHKDTLTPYTEKELNYPDIVVSDVHVFENKAPQGKKNQLNTFWDWSVIRLLIGVDFLVPPSRRQSVSARLTHLNHHDFSYKFTVNNKARKAKLGVVRIFIAPRFDERGERFAFEEQRKMMIEMDKFKLSIPPGSTAFVRSSLDSAVTIPWSSSLYHFTENNLPPEEAYTGCGWPHHMLLPKGRKGGFSMDLFVMISNDPDSAIPIPDGKPKPAFTMCGLRGRKYPDSRPMGYPFDRRANDDVETLADFLQPNMATSGFKVHFNDAYLRDPPAEQP